MAAVTLDDVMGALAELRGEVVALKAKVAALEARSPAAAGPVPEEVSEEVLVVLAAAVTSFLGKKVRIRSARLLSHPSSDGSSPWAHHGRVFVQAASHQLRRTR